MDTIDLDIPTGNPVRISESVGDLRAMARQAKSKASGQRNLDKRADDLVLDGLMASTRLALSNVSLPDTSDGEVVFPRQLVDEEGAEELPAERPTRVPRKPLAVSAIRVLNGVVVLLVVAALGGLSAFAYQHFTGERSVAQAAPVAPVVATAVELEEGVANLEEGAAKLEVASPATPEPMTAVEPAQAPVQSAAVAVAQPAKAAAKGDGRQAASPALVVKTDDHQAAKPPVPVANDAEQAIEAEAAGAEAVAVAPEVAASAEGIAAPNSAQPAVVVEASPPAPKNKSIDELLDQGAADLQLDGPPEKAKPAKTSITRAELKAAMRSIRGRIHGCAARTSTNGIAKLKFTVEPSGKVTNVAAVGKLSGSEFETCVKPAVKRAKFPVYEGPPSSFTFPVMLTR